MDNNLIKNLSVIVKYRINLICGYVKKSWRKINFLHLYAFQAISLTFVKNLFEGFLNYYYML